MASGLAGACCATRGIAAKARPSAATQLVKFAFRIILYGSCIVSSILYFATAATGRTAGFDPAGGVAAALMVKKVVTVHVPLIVVLGRTG